MADENKVRVIMVRENMSSIENIPVPDGFHFRFYQKGFEQHWIGIHSKADRWNKADYHLFEYQFGSDLPVLSRRQLYLFKADKAVATATAWYDTQGPWEGFGRVHWVAVLPEYQGQGLGKAVVSRVLQELKALGHNRVVLDTDTRRPEAIGLYERFGFKKIL